MRFSSTLSGLVALHGKRRCWAVQHRIERVERGVPTEWPHAGEQLVQEDAEREHVAPRVHRGAACLLRRHVRHGPEQDTWRRGEHRALAAPVGRHALGQAEVDDLDAALPREQHVGGLEIPVDDAVGMRVGEGIADLHGQPEGTLEGNGAPIDQRGQRRARHEFHGDEVDVRVVADVVDDGNAGVLERGRRTGLAPEAVPGVRIGRQGVVEHLERHGPIQAGVRGTVDHTHASPAELFANGVMCDPPAG
jgi:hypothetical protein